MNWQIVERQFDVQCEKYLICIDNNNCIEVAVINHNGETHLCIPTQIGCPINCIHCATTYSSNTFSGNINYNILCEISEFFINKYPDKNVILSFSGHGEPLLNWKNVFDVACKYKTRVKHIYVTTIGVSKVLKNICESTSNFISFYFSIHASNDDKRMKLIPAQNNISTLRDIVDFTNEYGYLNGNIVWNYMIHSENCDESDLNELISLFKSVKANINVRFTAFMNITSENAKQTSIRPASKEQFNNFINSIISYQDEFPNISFRISTIEGEAIEAACGQMRAHYYSKR